MDGLVFNVRRAGRRIAAEAKAAPATGVAVHGWKVGGRSDAIQVHQSALCRYEALRPNRTRAHTGTARSLCGGPGLPVYWTNELSAPSNLNRASSSAPSPSFGAEVAYSIYTPRRRRLLSPLSGNRLRTAG